MWTLVGTKIVSVYKTTTTLLQASDLPEFAHLCLCFVGQVLISTALLSFIKQKILPASTVATGTMVLTLILRLLVLTRTVAYLINVFWKSSPRLQHRPSLITPPRFALSVASMPLNNGTSARLSAVTTWL